VRQMIKASTDPDRVVASRDGGEIVGVAVSLPVTLTLPGPAAAPAAGVVGVAVLPTHRRQGRLRSMMRYQLDDLRRRGEAIATLTSSEAGIYQRFGYGPATRASWYTIESRTVRVEPPGLLGAPALSGTSGRVRFVDRAEAAQLFPQLLAAYQPTRAGEVSRLAAGWLDVLGHESDEEQRRRFFAIHENGGRPEGYVAYRVLVEPGARRQRVVHLDELCALSADAYLSLWSFLVDLDLVDRIETAQRPVDEPIRWALSDYRRMRPRATAEHTFVRLVDVARALSARRYDDDGALVLSVSDPFCSWNRGTYRLRSSGGDVEVDGPRPSAATGPEEADLELDVSVLASIYLGGLRPGSLAAVGLIREKTPGALVTCDRMFRGAEPPYCTTSF
jgi:predicted acetyltransferase